MGAKNRMKFDNTLLQSQEGQELKLIVEHVSVLKRRSGEDIISFRIKKEMSEHFLQESVGEIIAEKVYGNYVWLECKITKGCGEMLCEAMGLKVHETINS